MQIHSRVNCDLGLLFRYLRTRFRVLLWWFWPLVTLPTAIDQIVRWQTDWVQVLVSTVLILGGIVAVLCWLAASLVQAIVSRMTTGLVWEYAVDEDTVSMSAEAVRFEFRWSDLQKYRTHSFGWRLWFGARTSRFGTLGMQVLLPRDGLTDDEARLIDDFLERQTAP